MNVKRQQTGFTLVEVLIGLAVLGILIGSFFRVVGNTVDTSTELSVRNEVVQDAQIAQQIINARLQEACFVYTSGNIQMTAAGVTTARTILGLSGQVWNVATDPIVAMILPPDPNEPNAADRDNYRFYAYYPQLRSYYISNAAAINRLPTEAANANNWVLMEYKVLLPTAPSDPAPSMNPSPQTCAGNVAAGNAVITGGQGRLLVDYVQPTFISASNPLNYQMFQIETFAAPTPPLTQAPPKITFRLRMSRTYRGSATIRVPGSNEPPMQVTTAPQNNGL